LCPARLDAAIYRSITGYRDQAVWRSHPDEAFEGIT